MSVEPVKEKQGKKINVSVPWEVLGVTSMHCRSSMSEATFQIPHSCSSHDGLCYNEGLLVVEVSWCVHTEGLREG